MAHSKELASSGNDPLWYKDAIFYELHVRSFCDSDGDGVGDFPGLTSRLDYLQDLGVTTLWLLPYYPSPLKDDGYDISDYTGVHPAYGTQRDFNTFLAQAHDRGLRVVTELVLNHTSNQHAWFQRARAAKPGSRWRDFYVWSETPDKYAGARIIFKDFESSNWAWDNEAEAYYWHRFYSHQPDLNYESPGVRRAILQAVDFWLGLGVDGLRLDAVPYLYERESTSCENLPETHAFLKELRRHVDERFTHRLLLGEANQWPEDAIAYFSNGDECHMAFHFPLMPRLFMAIRMEDRFPIIDILRQTPPIPDICQWALFLRNHDELTLEMVTDEERDYMYRVYAQDPQAQINLGIRRRLAPLLGNNRRRIELMNGLLFSLPGTPVIYYGDEIGMGDNIYLGDRNGVRTPMQWSPDRNAGFSSANPQQLFLPVIIDPEYHYETVNVEAQQKNLSSLFWWMKRLIALRKRYCAFGHGSLEFLYPENRKVLAFVRRYEEERILVVANLSRFVQSAELDLSAFEGLAPVELFGRTRFPAIKRAPYFLTLGPHDFYWFTLEPERVQPAAVAVSAVGPPTVYVGSLEDEAIWGRDKGALENVLPEYLYKQPWFLGRKRTIRSAEIADTVPIAKIAEGLDAHLLLVRVYYQEGEPETYVLHLALAMGRRAARRGKEFPEAAVARLQTEATGQGGLIYDALREKSYCRALLDAIARRRRFKSGGGEVLSWPTPAFHRLGGDLVNSLEPTVLGAQQSNTSIVYGDRFILKLFRRLDPGVNPELEVGRFLTESTSFTNAPPVAGAIERRLGRRREAATVGLLQGFIPHQGDAWRYTLDALGRFFERALATRRQGSAAGEPPAHPLALAEEVPPKLARELIGAYLETARLLGQRTAELHLALSSATDDPKFAPEPFTAYYRRSIYQSMRNAHAQVFHLVRTRLKELPEAVRPEAQALLDREDEILGRFRSLLERRIVATRIRCHGAYHLGHLLHTGKDFVIIDFGGEPFLPLSERRLKRSPLRDVADMLRSFHYAAYRALFDVETGAVACPEDIPILEPFVRLWYPWVSATFLKSYLALMSQTAVLPQRRDDLRAMLDAYLLERAINELGFELDNRPDWLRIPIRGIVELLETPP
ncbi:MAG: maltose alpha-D-glucosyltransferase [Chloroflexi bacterium]|nr:maltose alpha-D-glucosyltransferase [Chloroflexota bacterium]